MKYLIALITFTALTNTYAQESQCLFDRNERPDELTRIETHGSYEWQPRDLIREVALNSFSSLSQEAREVLILTGIELNVSDIELSNEDGIIRFYKNFDDFDIYTTSITSKNEEEVFEVSFGVGGGNGGYHYYKKISNGGYKLVGSFFDGDELFCDEDYRQ